VIHQNFYRSEVDICFIKHLPKTANQAQPAKIIFRRYPNINRAYLLINHLRSIFLKTTDIGIAFTKLIYWCNKGILVLKFSRHWPIQSILTTF
jgi:hypothetical protein